MKFEEIFDKIKWVISTSLQLHSKSPNEEIKRVWEIVAIGTGFIFFMNLLSGMPIILNFNIDFPFSEVLNNYGGFIFWLFTILFIIVFLKISNNKDKKMPNLKYYNNQVNGKES
jgi:hypothetical protein